MEGRKLSTMEITFQPIGVFHTPFTALSDMPIQPGGKASALGTVELSSEFTEGLKDLDGFSHVILIYYLHKVSRSTLTVTPFLDSEPHGVFATRAPTRPNPIGLSVVRLLRIEGNILYLGNLDVLNGTPLLDIKPYVPDFDAPEETSIGWLEGRGVSMRSTKADDRFL